MGSHRVLRISLATLLLVLISGYWSIATLTKVRESAANRPAVNFIDAYEQRFARARVKLPPDSVLGYVTDQPASPGQDYLLTQYAMAPVVVVKTPRRELVLGNFHDPRAVGPVTQPLGLTPVEDFGQGIILLKGGAGQ